MRGAVPSKPISAIPAPARCRARWSHGAAGGRRTPPPSRRFRPFPLLAFGLSASSERPTRVGQLGLNLITGPANAGKVALLLRRYLEALPREPHLIVPNRSDVEEREREL